MLIIWDYPNILYVDPIINFLWFGRHVQTVPSYNVLTCGVFNLMMMQR